LPSEMAKRGRICKKREKIFILHKNVFNV